MKINANKAAVLLLVIGLLQMTGDLTGVTALKGIGAATLAAPAPKVFTSVRGLEAYSVRFYLEWTDRGGCVHSVQLTPEIYRRMAGPYNRRNVYGAVLAGGPVMASDERLLPMFQAVTNYALCGDAPLLREMGIDPQSVAGRVRIRYEPLPGTTMNHLPRVLEAQCQ
ncbi:MAG TPA: hypothetical protein VFD58_25625 [Blastocatellia bacterium]|nr:hypothetical protein [Blastocatellia bacterium]